MFVRRARVIEQKAHIYRSEVKFPIVYEPIKIYHDEGNKETERCKELTKKSLSSVSIRHTCTYTQALCCRVVVLENSTGNKTRNC